MRGGSCGEAAARKDSARQCSTPDIGTASQVLLKIKSANGIKFLLKVFLYVSPSVLGGGSYLRRINDSGLKGVPTRLALPEMADTRTIEILGPFGQKQLVAALSAFGHRAGYRRVAEIKTHGTFLTRLSRALMRDVFC